MNWPTFRTELWRVGIVHAPIARLRDPADLRATPVTWLPDPGDFRFYADPFGLWRDGRLHVFVEDFDYRDKRGRIRHFTFDSAFNLRDAAPALQAPHHLSYPYLIEDAGEVFMLPEAHRSGKLTLYRAKAFPDEWEPEYDLLDVPAIDASVIRVQDRWWMFYALPGPDRRAMRELHVAWAERLTGPWHAHPLNPVRVDLDSARPGGTPFMADHALYLPTQDCTVDYGGAVNWLRIVDLTPTTWRASVPSRLSPSDIATDWNAGLHTISACGDVTLIDVKRIERSPRRLAINWLRRWRRFVSAGASR